MSAHVDLGRLGQLEIGDRGEPAVLLALRNLGLPTSSKPSITYSSQCAEA